MTEDARTAVRPDDTPEPDDPEPETDAPPAATGAAGERLQQERDEYYDRLLRVTAEFDNYRKRVERERRDTFDRAAASVLEELLPVVDDLDRALAADSGPEAEGYRRGVEIIQRQLSDLLTRRGVTPVPAVGTDFDPHLHQAVSYEPAEGARDGEVIEELRRGYKLGERLLRPAMVKVAKA